MYNYDYSRASLEPQIEGPSTVVKMGTLPKIEDRVGPFVLGTREARPSDLVLVPKSMATRIPQITNTTEGTKSQIVCCVGRIPESPTQFRNPRRDPQYTKCPKDL